MGLFMHEGRFWQQSHWNYRIILWGGKGMSIKLKPEWMNINIIIHYYIQLLWLANCKNIRVLSGARVVQWWEHSASSHQFVPCSITGPSNVWVRVCWWFSSCCERLFSGYYRIPLSSGTKMSKFQYITRVEMIIGHDSSFPQTNTRFLDLIHWHLQIINSPAPKLDPNNPWSNTSQFYLPLP